MAAAAQNNAAKSGTIGPNSPIANPGTTLSGQSLIDAAKALSDAQTIGPITQLAQQIAQNDRQGAASQKLTSGYFKGLGGFAKQSYANEGQVASDLNSQLGGIAAGEQQALRGIGQNATQQMHQYAPQGQGAWTANPAMQGLTTELARQQGLAAQNEGAFKSFGATQGANYRGLAASNEGTFALRGQERLADIAKATRLENLPLNQKIAALRAAQGALFATKVGALRQQEIANAFTAKGLKVKQSAIAASILNNQNNNSTKTSIANANRSAQNNRHAHPVATPTSPSSKPAISLGKQYQLLSKAVGLITQGHTASTSHPHGFSNTEIRAGLAGKYNIPDYLIQAAFELYTYHYVSPATAALMRANGFHGGSFRGSPIAIGGPNAPNGYLASDNPAR